MAKSLYWADQLARKVVRAFPKAKLYTVAAGITPSGTIHIGNFREIITVDIIYRAIRDLGKKARFIYSWDDYDHIRKIPKNIPNAKAFEKYLFVPGVDAPDPWKCHKSYTEHFEKELQDVLPEVGIEPKYIYQNKRYRACVYADQIKFVLSERKNIRKILDKYRSEPLPKKWFPVLVFCEKCKRAQTEVTEWDGGYALSYNCKCRYQGQTNFKKKGNVKLPWRVDWPMRWKYEKVSCEGGGKEHNTVGGSLDTGQDLSKTVFKYGPPVRFMYDFITIKGQKGKMSGSKGDVVTLGTVLKVYLPDIVRYIFASTKPQMEFKISLDEDALKIYEDFYECERIYFGKKKVSDKAKAHWSRVYEMSCVGKPPISMPIQPNFKHCVELINIHQTPKRALAKVVELEKLTKKQDRERYLAILERAKNWLDNYAPEQYKFSIQEEPTVSGLSSSQKAAIKDLATILNKSLSEKQLFAVFYDIVKKNNLKAPQFFQAVYKVLLNRERGPRLAPFILAVGRIKVKRLLELALKNKTTKTKVGIKQKLSVEEEIFNQKSIIVGKITRVSKHPNADKLKVCEVNLDKKKLKIVSGCNNIKINLITAIALPSAKILDWKGSREIQKVKKVSIRGVKSEAVLCAPEEVGIHVPRKQRELLLELKGKVKLGEPISKFFKLSEL